MTKTSIKPLFIACSGGWGHIAAVHGLIEHLSSDHHLQLTEHSGQIAQDRTIQNPSFYAKRLRQGIRLLSTPYLGTFLKKIPIPWGLRYLPHQNEFFIELDRLVHTEKTHGCTRPYVDLLLDVYPTGYDFAAIFNTLQRKDDTTGIRAIVQAQPASDRMHHHLVYKHIFTMLCQAAKQGLAYTEIISTQPQSLAALCDAVMHYNQRYAPIIIKQYLTDLPTSGAHHFFRSLQRLTSKQQQQMAIYAVCNDVQDIVDYLKYPTAFAGLYALKKQDNPMVRVCIKNESLKQLTQTHLDCTLHYATPEGTKTVIIPAQAHVACIMLGSLAGHATIHYAKHCIETKKYAYIFIFRADNTHIDEALVAYTKNCTNIICLGQQTAGQRAAIMTRSQCMILRCGGLTTMENMILPIIPNKTFFFHYPDQGNEKNVNEALQNG